MAITFDDGPHPEGHPQILEVLAEFDTKATFFLVGEQVVKRPALARQIVTMGHTVGLHGYVHRPHPTRNSRAMVYDFEHGIAAIADATGVEPRMHRPPYGIYSPASLRMARERGLHARCSGPSGVRTGARSPRRSRSRTVSLTDWRRGT